MLVRRVLITINRDNVGYDVSNLLLLLNHVVLLALCKINVNIISTLVNKNTYYCYYCYYYY